MRKMLSIGLVYVGEFASSSSAGQPRKEEVKRERFGCQASKENGA